MNTMTSVKTPPIYIVLSMTMMIICLQIKTEVTATSLVRERCFDDPPIGCFSTAYPFNNTYKLPHSPQFINIHYRHTIGDDTAKIHWRDAPEAMKTRFRPDLKTVVIMHGFKETGFKSWVRDIVSELSKLPELVNIVVVDWSRGATVLTYQQSIANGRVVSAMTTMFLKDLISLGASPASIHFIGNSLGAHLAGQAASGIPGIGRVTGMDPNRAFMIDSAPEVRLDPTDAIIVDVIHTEGAENFGYGTMVPMGTIDFYPNGGERQPGCSILLDLILDGLFVWHSKCSHSRARKLFIDSISTCSITAGQCSSLESISEKRCTGCVEDGTCVTFGYHMEPGHNGLYAFETGWRRPYCNDLE